MRINAIVQHDNIISFGNVPASARLSLDEKSRQTVDKCCVVYLKMLPPLLTALFETLDDSLFELSEKAESDAQQSSYFDAMRKMRKERIRIEKQFKDKIAVEYDHFWIYGPGDGQGESEQDGLATELSLLGEETLEETLAITSLVSKCENRCQCDLEALNERFGHILKSDQVNHQNNPVGPTTIGNVFRGLLEPILIDLPIKLVIYKLFDKEVMHYVGDIYAEINQQLKRGGVLPKLASRIRLNPVAPSHRRDRSKASYREAVSTGIGELDVEAQSEIFQSIQSLLTNHNMGGTLSLGAPPGISLPTVERPDLLNTLSALQSSNIMLVAHVGAADEQQNLRESLVQSLQMRSGGELKKSLEKSDNDTIDVLSMVFEFILDDPNLPDPMKALIGRLQIPMLKIALVDKTFFSKNGHPARHFLNSIARVAVGWTDNGDRSEKSLYGVIERMIRRILDEFDQDARLFEQLNEEFSAFFDTEELGAEVAEERTNQVMRGKEQLKVAKMHVSNEINARLAHMREVPEVVQVLLHEGWKDVLLLLYLRQGVESEVWAKGIETMDVLLWSVEPKSQPAERKELLKKTPSLLRALREGLAEISYDQHKMARLFKELQRCHILCMRGEHGLVNRVKTEELSISPNASFNSEIKPSSGAAPAKTKRERPAIQDQFFDQANATKVGTWFELSGEEDDKKRIKLSWKSDVTDAFVFVNRRGMKVKEISVGEFSRLLRDGRATPLKNTAEPLMDRALHAMMDVLKKTESTAVVT
jgi:hypothetical protein